MMSFVIPSEAMLSPVGLDHLLDHSPVPTFVLNAQHVVTHWNRGCALVTGCPAQQMIGTRSPWQAFYRQPRPVLADLLLDHADAVLLSRYYADKFRVSGSIPGAYEAEDCFDHLPGGGRWLMFTAARLLDQDGKLVGAIETLQDITGRKQAELRLQELNEELELRIAARTAELQAANRSLRTTISQMEQMQTALGYVD